jgi:mannose-6-phosphate isomerase-like protein (cupin superfamily)
LKKEIHSEKVNLSEKFSLFTNHWEPKIVGELNEQYVKLAKLKGEFVWHQHENEDELFMVIKGSLTIKLREKDICLSEGEIFIIPRGVEHMPIAKKEVHVLMFEPKGTVNTGDTESDKKIDLLEKL